MPPKKRRTPAASTRSLFRLQANMRRLQRDAERLLGHTQKRASSLISRNQRRAVERLLGQATRARNDFERRAERATKDLEARAERFLSTLEKEASKRLGPVMRKLDLPSRRELQALGRRVSQLERKLAQARNAPPFHPEPQTGDSEAGSQPRES